MGWHRQNRKRGKGKRRPRTSLEQERSIRHPVAPPSFPHKDKSKYDRKDYNVEE